MLFEHSLDMVKASEIIEKGITEALAEGYRTADIASEGSKIVSTKDFTKIISENIERIFTDEAIGVFLL